MTTAPGDAVPTGRRWIVDAAMSTRSAPVVLIVRVPAPAGRCAPRRPVPVVRARSSPATSTHASRPSSRDTSYFRGESTEAAGEKLKPQSSASARPFGAASTTRPRRCA